MLRWEKWSVLAAKKNLGRFFHPQDAEGRALLAIFDYLQLPKEETSTGFGKGLVVGVWGKNKQNPGEKKKKKSQSPAELGGEVRNRYQEGETKIQMQ